MGIRGACGRESLERPSRVMCCALRVDSVRACATSTIVRSRATASEGA
ncbi:hypothetical protein RAJCM14343_3517 [Rhodococcus aetherivorans]|uniref:Uncharacterized protein n=1 Tax=Rhodococcus aetherivorans TaxID=191292 RepID=A0ABQ0YNV7_9NOCA|nr:hypothetical protein RAJCM14343_3517 [Rhodococcus aetherivorans]CCW11721.1 hypothetical protein EBESD8_22640 [Rhodococcus aetherivorans]